MNRATLRPLRTHRFGSLPASSDTVNRSTSTVSVATLRTANDKTRQTLAAVGALWLAFASAHAAPNTPADAAHVDGSPAAMSPTPKTNLSPKLARGRYLVEHVGLCADCHTPRDQKGQFLREHWLMGSQLPFQPTVPMPWAPVSPPIAGLPSMTEEQAVVFLQTGKRPDGTMPRPPMPEYRFGLEDAKAVAAYLKSVKSLPAPAKPVAAQ